MNTLKETLARVKNLSERISVKVTFKNGASLSTEINTDLAGAKKYYIGKEFNLGTGGKDVMTKAVKVELSPED